MYTNKSYQGLHPARNEFFSGIKAELPLMIGVIPFGMIYGILAHKECDLYYSDRHACFVDITIIVQLTQSPPINCSSEE